MNSNVKEIGHLSFKLKNEKEFRNFYENVLGLKTGFILKNKLDEDRIVYYQLNRHQFIEIFPENSVTQWPTYDGKSKEDRYSYQFATIGQGDSKHIVKDPEGNQWVFNGKERFISKVTYNVNDLQKAKTFYRDILLLDLIEDTPEKAVAKINDYQLVELIQKTYPDDNCTDNKGYCHFALIVHDIEKEARRLEGLGVQLYHGPKTFKMPYTAPYEAVKHSENTYNFYMQDYDDNEIEAMGYTEESFQVIYSSK